jgi:hypothetical protein
MMADMMLWKEALEYICPSRRRLNCLGQYVAKSHQVGEWRWCALLNELLRYYQSAASMDVYKNTTSLTDTRRVSQLHEWYGGTSAWLMKYSQGSSALHPWHRRHRTWPNQQPLWRSCMSGDTAGYGSTCLSMEEQTGLHKQSRPDHWWPSRTGLTYGRYIHNYARQPLSWNAHTAVGNLSAHSKRHLRPQTHTGENYWD